MSAVQLLCELAGIKSFAFSKEEKLLLEVNLFTHICLELQDEFRRSYKNYLFILKCNKKMEDTFVEMGFVRYIIQDILSTKEYSLLGVACYTHIPEDVIYDILSEKNNDPSASIVRKIIELHRLVRPELYNHIMQKLVTETHHKSLDQAS